MHPQIRQVGPGFCPICGMVLEPVDSTVDIRTNPELVDMRRRFWIGVPLALVCWYSRWVMTSEDSPRSPILPGPVGSVRAVDAGRPLVRLAVPGAWCEIPQTTPVEHVHLIALGVAAAYLYSVIAILAPQLFPADLRDMHGHIGVYFEASAVIIVLVLLGQVLELQARERTGGRFGLT